MVTFAVCFEKIIEHEGGYANITGDRGGETYMGIARNIHPYWNGWSLVDHYRKKNGGTLPHNYKINDNLLHTKVARFYHDEFWKKYNIHLIVNNNLKYIIFDWCVNSGYYGAKGVQKVLSRFGHNLKPDGILGKHTIQAINTCNAIDLFESIKTARIKYYNKISTGDNAKFLNGWLNRINSIEYGEL